jgi:hypothetical protein
MSGSVAIVERPHPVPDYKESEACAPSARQSEACVPIARLVNVLLMFLCESKARLTCGNCLVWFALYHLWYKLNLLIQDNEQTSLPGALTSR